MRYICKNATRETHRELGRMFVSAVCAQEGAKAFDDVSLLKCDFETKLAEPIQEEINKAKTEEAEVDYCDLGYRRSFSDYA